jgi:hypothetical protein
LSAVWSPLKFKDILQSSASVGLQYTVSRISSRLQYTGRCIVGQTDAWLNPHTVQLQATTAELKLSRKISTFPTSTRTSSMQGSSMKMYLYTAKNGNDVQHQSKRRDVVDRVWLRTETRHLLGGVLFFVVPTNQTCLAAIEASYYYFAVSCST